MLGSLTHETSFSHSQMASWQPWQAQTMSSHQLIANLVNRWPGKWAHQPCHPRRLSSDSTTSGPTQHSSASRLQRLTICATRPSSPLISTTRTTSSAENRQKWNVIRCKQWIWKWQRDVSRTAHSKGRRLSCVVSLRLSNRHSSRSCRSRVSRPHYLSTSPNLWPSSVSTGKTMGIKMSRALSMSKPMR